MLKAALKCWPDLLGFADRFAEAIRCLGKLGKVRRWIKNAPFVVTGAHHHTVRIQPA